MVILIKDIIVNKNGRVIVLCYDEDKYLKGKVMV